MSIFVACLKNVYVLDFSSQAVAIGFNAAPSV